MSLRHDVGDAAIIVEEEYVTDKDSIEQQQQQYQQQDLAAGDVLSLLRRRLAGVNVAHLTLETACFLAEFYCAHIAPGLSLSERDAEEHFWPVLDVAFLTEGSTNHGGAEGCPVARSSATDLRSTSSDDADVERPQHSEQLALRLWNLLVEDAVVSAGHVLVGEALKASTPISTASVAPAGTASMMLPWSSSMGSADSTTISTERGNGTGNDLHLQQQQQQQQLLVDRVHFALAVLARYFPPARVRVIDSDSGTSTRVNDGAHEGQFQRYRRSHGFACILRDACAADSVFRQQQQKSRKCSSSAEEEVIGRPGRSSSITSPGCTAFSGRSSSDSVMDVIASLVRFPDRLSGFFGQQLHNAQLDAMSRRRLEVLADAWSPSSYFQSLLQESLIQLAPASAASTTPHDHRGRTLAISAESTASVAALWDTVCIRGLAAEAAKVASWFVRDFDCARSIAAVEVDDSEVPETTPLACSDSNSDLACRCEDIWHVLLSGVFCRLREGTFDTLAEALLVRAIADKRASHQGHTTAVSATLNHKLLAATLVARLVHVQAADNQRLIDLLANRFLFVHRLPASGLRALVYVSTRVDSIRHKLGLTEIRQLAPSALCAALADVWSDPVFLNGCSEIQHRYISHALQRFMAYDVHVRCADEQDTAATVCNGQSNAKRKVVDRSHAHLRERCVSKLLTGVQAHFSCVDPNTRRRGMRIGECMSEFITPQLHACFAGQKAPDDAIILKFERNETGADSDDEGGWCLLCPPPSYSPSATSFATEQHSLDTADVLDSMPSLRQSKKRMHRGKRRSRLKSMVTPALSTNTQLDPDFLVWENDSDGGMLSSGDFDSPTDSSDNDNDVLETSSTAYSDESSADDDVSEFVPYDDDSEENGGFADGRQPMYIRDIIEALQNTKTRSGASGSANGDVMETALFVCEGAIRGNPADLPSLAPRLLSVLLSLPANDEYTSLFELYDKERGGENSNAVEVARFSCLVACTVQVPDVSAKFLGTELWRAGCYSVQQRSDILRVLGAAAFEIAAISHSGSIIALSSPPVTVINAAVQEVAEKSPVAGVTRWKSSRVGSALAVVAGQSRPGSSAMNKFAQVAPQFLYPLLEKDPARDASRNTRSHASDRSALLVVRTTPSHPIGGNIGLEWFGSDAALLSQLLRSISEIVIAARGAHTLGERAARTVLDFTRSLRLHPDNRVRLGVLWASAVTLVTGVDSSSGSASVPLVPAALLCSGTWRADIDDIRSWLYSSVEQDPDDDCRSLALFFSVKLDAQFRSS